MIISDSDFEWLMDILAQAGANEIMPHFRRLSDDDISSKKNAADLVTIADVAAEKFLTRALQEKFPNASVFGEEAVSADPSILQSHPWEGLSFVIDPIDGTFNFASGAPIFGTILAIVNNSETIGAIIHDPVMKDWIYARKGEGGFYRQADGKEKKLKVADDVPFDQMTGSLSWTGIPPEERAKFLANQARNLNFFGYRCAVHDYRILATGMAHYVFYGKMMPWDHLAGTLIHQESGGFSARFDKSPYRPQTIDGCLIHATSEAAWDEIRRELWAE
jgi:fructose-1,6-bisphosphatase/inositol monophosphatase family enzyme